MTAAGPFTALVTGASRGFGAEVALALAGAGYHVAAVARTVGGLEELDDRVRRLGGEATLVPLDLTELDALAPLAARLDERFGRLDLLVHAAAASISLTPVRDLPRKEFARLWKLHVECIPALAQAFEPLLLRSRGRVRLIGNRHCAGPYKGAYAATQAAARALAAAWKAERSGLDIEMHDPPAMATALRRRNHPGEPPGRLADPAREASKFLRSLPPPGLQPQGSFEDSQ